MGPMALLHWKRVPNANAFFGYVVDMSVEC